MVVVGVGGVFVNAWPATGNSRWCSGERVQQIILSCHKIFL